MDEARLDIARLRARAHLRRVHLALRRPENWLELIRYCLVGASGYGVNLGAFWLAGRAIAYLPAFALSFVIAASWNFAWNRRWTFPAGHGKPHHQYARFLTVSGAALAFDLAVLALLVERLGVAKLPAAAITIVIATPISFFGNKLWSFR